MREVTLRGRDVMLLAGTRMALGVGIGLLVATMLNERVRRGAGWTLVAVGALTTIPIMFSVRAGRRRLGGKSEEQRRPAMGPWEGRHAGTDGNQPAAP